MLVMNSLVVLRDERCLFAPVTQEFQQGDMVHIQGPNGRGKTSLLRTLAGVYPHFRGDFKWPMAIRPIYLGQSPGLNMTMTLQENMHQLFRVLSLPLHASDSILLQLDLMAHVHRRLDRLSTGQIRKVGLSPLLHPDVSPTAWLLDEPFASLDQGMCEWFEHRFIDLTNNGALIIMTSHQGFSTLPLRSKALTVPLKDYAAQTGEGVIH